MSRVEASTAQTPTDASSRRQAASPVLLTPRVPAQRASRLEQPPALAFARQLPLPARSSSPFKGAPPAPSLDLTVLAQ